MYQFSDLLSIGCLVLIVLVHSGCSDNEFSPEKKSSIISFSKEFEQYVNSSYHKKVEYLDFQYNEKNQLLKLISTEDWPTEDFENYGFVRSYAYDGNVIKIDGETVYHLDEKNRITKILSPAVIGLHDEIITTISYTPYEVIITTAYEKNAYSRAHTYTWDTNQENISKYVRVYTPFAGEPVIEAEFTFEYDHKKNPFKGLPLIDSYTSVGLSPYNFVTHLSKNNSIRTLRIDPKTNKPYYNCDLTYTYNNKGYPIRCTENVKRFIYGCCGGPQTTEYTYDYTFEYDLNN